MPQRTLKFLIRQDGRVEESVEGAMGASCHQLTEKLEEALGTVEHSQPTGEAFLLKQSQSQSVPAEIL